MTCPGLGATDGSHAYSRVSDSRNKWENNKANACEKSAFSLSSFANFPHSVIAHIHDYFQSYIDIQAYLIELAYNACLKMKKHNIVNGRLIPTCSKDN